MYLRTFIRNQRCHALASEYQGDVVNTRKVMIGIEVPNEKKRKT